MIWRFRAQYCTKRDIQSHKAFAVLLVFLNIYKIFLGIYIECRYIRKVIVNKLLFLGNICWFSNKKHVMRCSLYLSPKCVIFRGRLATLRLFFISLCIELNMIFVISIIIIKTIITNGFLSLRNFHTIFV